MNAKRAKKIRLAARTYAALINAPEVKQTLNFKGKSIINAPFSGRGLYLRMKREAQGKPPHAKDI
jgi:hypothetical protein